MLRSLIDQLNSLSQDFWMLLAWVMSPPDPPQIEPQPDYSNWTFEDEVAWEDTDGTDVADIDEYIEDYIDDHYEPDIFDDCA